MRRQILPPPGNPWKVFIRTAMLCSLAGVLLFGLALRKIEPLPTSGATPQFDQAQAFTYMSQLAKGFPNRVTWGPTRKQAALWVKDQFRQLGYEPRGLQFSEVIAARQYTDLEDVYAIKKGTKHPDEIIVMMAHYDITDTTVEGAMDDAAGVGVVLELAKIFSKQPTDRTLLFLVDDSEEFGAFWGARAFAHSYENADKIIAAASFDFPSPEKQTEILTLCDGLKSGYTPLWLRELALNSIRSLGELKAGDMDGALEFIERAMQIPPSDHGAMLQAGIPSFNWVGQTDNFAHIMSYYHHTPNDRVEAMLPDSFGTYGRAAERLIRSIDELSRVPEDFKNSSYWKVTSRLYMDGWAVTLLHILAFIPFLAYCISKFRVTLKPRPRERVMTVVKNELKNAGILMASLMLGFVVMRLLPTLRMITQYETFPATQKSILLYTPDFMAILVVVLAVLGVYGIFRGAFAEAEDSIGFIEIRHALHAVLLAIIIFLAFLKNSYLAVLLLLPPAYLWTAVRARRRREDRILNMLLLLGGAITFIIMAIVLSTVFHVGVVYWYIFLAATYGLFSAYSVVLFFMALTVMIRIFRAFVL